MESIFGSVRLVSVTRISRFERSPIFVHLLSFRVAGVFLQKSRRSAGKKGCQQKVHRVKRSVGCDLQVGLCVIV